MTSSPPALLVYITTPDADTARMLARLAVEQKLAACANLLENMESIFRWEGKVQSTRETVLLLKTIPARFDALQALITAHHPYAYPCIIALPVNAGLPDFLAWIASETAPDSPST